MSEIKKLIKFLSTADLIVIVFLYGLSIINLAYASRVTVWRINTSVNIIFILFVFTATYKSETTNKFIWKQLHIWYLVPFVFIAYKELYFMIAPIQGQIYDYALIIIDRLIFRADPTVELFKIANPYLTELLQIVYGTFFFLPVILGFDLIRQNKTEEFNYAAFIIVYGFCLSFIGYIFVPAIGPRFTLHNYETNNIEMPGVLITNILREIVNSGESIPSGTLYPALLVQRDAFPSGHTEMTLLVMFLSVKYKSRFKWFFIPNGLLLIFATVYLRYHYVTDLIGGLIFMIFTLWSGKYIDKGFKLFIKHLT
jgi:membrane-associated phospholipid phosphatase